MPLTDAQKTAAAYAHFTLEEWQLLAKCVNQTHAYLYGTKQELDKEKVFAMLAKFPSAVL
jgi:hypothetical protein